MYSPLSNRPLMFCTLINARGFDGTMIIGSLPLLVILSNKDPPAMISALCFIFLARYDSFRLVIKKRLASRHASKATSAKLSFCSLVRFCGVIGTPVLGF